MIDVWKKIRISDSVGCGPYAMVTIDSIENKAILLGDERVYGDRHFVVYEDEVDRLIEALTELRKCL